MMFIQILANLKSQGFSLYASIDISPNQQDEKIESWFFKRDKVKDEGTESRVCQLAHGGDDNKTGRLVNF